MHGDVRVIYQDAKGYLWIGTGDGLSRFDGQRFVNYGAREGLEHRYINAIAEDRQGRLWLGTYGAGIARLIDRTEDGPPGRPAQSAREPVKFLSHRIGASLGSNLVYNLLFDNEDRIWCATDAGIYRSVGGRADPVVFEAVTPDQPTQWTQVFLDTQTGLWLGGEAGLLQITRDGRVRYGSADQVGRSPIRSIVQGWAGRVFLANTLEVFELVRGRANDRNTWRKLPVALGPDQGILTVAADPRGVLWIGTGKGLVRWTDGGQRIYGTAHGLPDDLIRALHVDRQGNIWIGSYSGLTKLPSETPTTFTQAEGLPDQHVARVVESLRGDIYASTLRSGLVRIVGGRVVPIPGSQAPPFRSVANRVLRDRRGDWWLGTDQGLYRFKGPDLQLQRGEKFTAPDGIPEAPVFVGPGLYEDPGGRIWISLLNGHVYVFDPERRGRPRFEQLPARVQGPIEHFVDMFCDRPGACWIGSYQGLGRLWNGRISLVRPDGGLPDLQARRFHRDSRGWLWIGLRYRGVSVTTDPTTERPRFRNYSTENGLSGDAVWCITEDQSGRIYLGTGRGLDRFDPGTGLVRSLRSVGSPAAEGVNHCFSDRQGNIWVATSQGLARYDPRAERPANWAPPIYLTQIRVGGEALRLPETGARVLAGVAASAARSHVLIEYSGVGFGEERPLRYQYRLDRLDEDWNLPTEDRSVTYARLAAGSYRFAVRAISQDGHVSPEPATFSFRVLPPVWQRWWFIGLALAALTAGAFALHRVRVGQLLAVEAIRRQVATDLHDDLGSGLSQVAILSEVVRHDAPAEDSELLGEIARLARAMREDMGDIVWAVDPTKDQLSDLVQRFRLVTFNLLEANGVRVEFQALDEREMERIALAPDRRRHLFLIFKEAITNVARHAGATRVGVQLHIDARMLSLVIEDNGSGFDPAAPHSGHGLANIRQRAASLGAHLTILSTPGGGTTVRLAFPLRS